MKKNYFVSLLVALAMVSTTTMASANSLSDQDMGFAFGVTSQSQQVSTLSDSEMMATKGAYGWWGAAAGWTTAAYTYTGYAYGSNSWSWGAFGRATTIGAISGFALPTPTAIGFAQRTAVGAAAGYSVGWSNWF